MQSLAGRNLAEQVGDEIPDRLIVLNYKNSYLQTRGYLHRALSAYSDAPSGFMVNNPGVRSSSVKKSC